MGDHHMEQLQDDHLLEGLAHGQQDQSFRHYHRQQAKSKMFRSGLLLAPGGEAGAGRALRNLLVSHPAPGMDDDVVYLQARVKFDDPKTFVLALDTRNGTLLGAAEFATERERGAGVMYFPSNISRYIDPGQGSSYP
uniref:Uncharacterized protein n=1 Tax=Arundo donax TaxID=35708 RepID=A0A0A8Z3W9_ARUDO